MFLSDRAALRQLESIARPTRPTEVAAAIAR
jgi:hypothetical protein